MLQRGEWGGVGRSGGSGESGGEWRFERVVRFFWSFEVFRGFGGF